MGEQGAVDVSGGFSSSHIVLYQSVVSIGSRNRDGQRYLSAQDGNCVWRLAVWLGSLGLIPQGNILRHKSLTLGFMRLELMLLGTVEGDSVAVQSVQATASAQADAKPLRDKLPKPLASEPAEGFSSSVRCPPDPAIPVPPSTPPFTSRQDRVWGKPPDRSNITAAVLPALKSAAHRLMVWGSCSSNSAVAEAVQPWGNRSMTRRLRVTKRDYQLPLQPNIVLTFCAGPKQRGGRRGAGRGVQRGVGRGVQRGVGEYRAGHQNQDGIGFPLRYLGRPCFKSIRCLP